MLECADGFWQLPNSLQEFIQLCEFMIPRMGPHHLELFFKYVVTQGLFNTDAVGGKSRVLSTELAQGLCKHVLPALLKQAFLLLNRYWTACRSGFAGTE